MTSSGATAPFRLGLVGAGRMGQTHLRALRGSDHAEIVAIVEPSPAIRAALDFPAELVHTQLDAMLDKHALDGVLIATPSAYHVATIERVAAAGLPILCEKPCGLSVDEAMQAAALANAAGVPLQIAYWRRFVPALRRLKERIAAGDFGALYMAACFQWDQTPPAAAFRKSGGGPFIDMGVHEFDQLRWLTGQEIGAVRVATSSTAFDDLIHEDPDAAHVLCDLSAGATGLISLGRRFPQGDACWVQIFGTSSFEDCRFLWGADGDSVFTAALESQAAGFADFVWGKASEGATSVDAIAALDAAERCRRLMSSVGVTETRLGEMR